tara:strand:- start:2145 stop:2585 length:441 start_codon:yes stop_codon:yes gene_type:complete
MVNRRKRKKRKPKYNYVYIEPTPEYIYNANFKLEIKKSTIDCGGNGVFTLEPIKNNTIIGEYIGDIREPGHAYDFGRYCVETKSGKLIDGFLYPRTIMAMINDSYGSKFTNNCEFQIYELKAEIVSTRDIEVNEELFLNYGDSYWI